MPRPHIVFAVVLLLPFGCDEDVADIGKPCAQHRNCASGLECDIHEGQGTCQRPHSDTGDEEPLGSTDHGHETMDEHASDDGEASTSATET